MIMQDEEDIRLLLFIIPRTNEKPLLYWGKASLSLCDLFFLNREEEAKKRKMKTYFKL